MLVERSLSSRRVFEGRVVSLRVDRVTLPGGGEATREVVDHAPAVVIVPIDARGDLILVRQYRYAVGKVLLEAPAGGVEAGEAPEECAQRELQEETGYLSRDLRSMGSFWTTPGFCNELMYAFAARDLVPSTLEPDPDERIETESVPQSQVAALIRGGEIQDGKTIAALLMLTCV